MLSKNKVNWRGVVCVRRGKKSVRNEYDMRVYWRNNSIVWYTSIWEISWVVLRGNVRGIEVEIKCVLLYLYAAN